MPADASFEAALASLGVLASHSCDAPLAPGSTLAPGCAVCGERRRGRRSERRGAAREVPTKKLRYASCLLEEVD